MGFLAFALLLPESASVPMTQGYAAHRGAQTLHRPFVPERRPGSMGRLVPIAVPLPYPILRDMSRPAQAGVPPGTKSPSQSRPSTQEEPCNTPVMPSKWHSRLQTLPTLADDAEEDAVLDALHARSCTCILRVIPIARQSGTIPLSPPV